MKPGTIDHYEGLDVLDEDPTFISWHKAHVEGETLPPEALGQLRQISLRGLGEMNSPEKMGETVLRLQDAVDILDPSGNSLKLAGMEFGDFHNTILGLVK